MSGDELPDEPLNKYEESAILWHEELLEFQRAGFTEEQAFQILLRKIDPYFYFSYEEWAWQLRRKRES